jgi:hypothetical protein
VVVLVPESEDSPRRSKVSKEFYIRIGPTTVPMAYFLIADRFGRRPHPRLRVDVTHETFFQNLERTFAVSVINDGRGLARFPAVRYQRIGGLELANVMRGQAPIWGFSDANPEWSSFRGDANDVVYPGEMLRIATLLHRDNRVHRESPRAFSDITITTEVVCEGMVAHRQTFSFDATEAP